MSLIERDVKVPTESKLIFRQFLETLLSSAEREYRDRAVALTDFGIENPNSVPNADLLRAAVMARHERLVLQDMIVRLNRHPYEDVAPFRDELHQLIFGSSVERELNRLRILGWTQL